VAVLTPREGHSLAQVVQAALNVAGPAQVSIVSGGTGAGVQLPDHHAAEVEAALGWTSSPEPEPEPDPSPLVVEGADVPAAPDLPQPPAAKAASAPPKKPTRRARRSEKE